MEKYIQPLKYKNCEIKSHNDNGKIQYSVWADGQGGSVGLHDDLKSAMMHVDMLKHNYVHIFHILLTLLLIASIIL